LRPPFTIKGTVKYNPANIPFPDEQIKNWLNTKFDVTEYVKFEMNKLKSNQ